MTLLSTNFTLEELTHTDTGLPNHPADTELDNLRRTAHLMEAVRVLLGHPIIVHSGYRSPAVNQAVRGVSTSAHCHGYAVDFVCPDFGKPVDIARAIAASPIQFDQCIEEGGAWVHISFDPRLRRQAMTATFHNGVSSYSKGVA